MRLSQRFFRYPHARYMLQVEKYKKSSSHTFQFERFWNVDILDVYVPRL